MSKRCTMKNKTIKDHLCHIEASLNCHLTEIIRCWESRAVELASAYVTETAVTDFKPHLPFCSAPQRRRPVRGVRRHRREVLKELQAKV